MTTRQQVMLLLAISSLWAGLLSWRLMNDDDPVRVPLANVSGPATSTTASRSTQHDELRVNLELLAASKTERETTFTAPRNIFAPPQTGQGGTGNLSVQDVSDVAKAEKLLRQQAVSAELGQFRYLGYLQVGNTPKQRQPLALLMKNEDLHMVHAGETIEDRVLVKSITPDGITLQETESRVEQTVPLTQEPVTQ